MGVHEVRSKIDGSLLHIFYKPDGLKRQNLCSDDQLLQGAEINLNDGDTFKAHKHLPTERITVGTQETWVVVRGKVMAYYYDLDDKPLWFAVLSSGDVTMTFAGGHNYQCLEDGTLVYEFKNGPYLGIEKDKVFI